MRDDDQLKVGLFSANSNNAVYDKPLSTRAVRHMEDTEASDAYLAKLVAKLSMLSRSRFVVGSSRANIPQLIQNVSANASRMMMDVSTFCPALQRPRICILTPFWTIMTCVQGGN